MKEEKTDSPPEIIKTEKTPSIFKPKILLVGLPIFIVQLVAVYFVTANILIPESHSAVTKENNKTENTTKVKEQHSGGSTESTTYEKEADGLIFSVDDMIVNPAQTNGKMLLLASLGLAVESEESKKALEEKQVVVKDAILGVLSSKNVTQLSSTTYRDTLKIEIIKKLSAQMPGSKVRNIYFSKFIIQ
jgi:flagellar FliL protein